jgi:glycosyltransferase involved in cell wall biosynthesis
MKILQVAYYYPPMGGAGVQRALKFSKYLPEFGVQPVVLAAHDPGYVSDASLLDDVPAGVRVERIEHRPLLQRALAWRSRRQHAAAVVAPPVAASSSLRPSTRDALLKAYAALQFPDDKAGWARRALAAGRRLIRDEGIELVFSSAPPVAAHALGQRLAREAGLPWVADYRDLWTDNPAYGAPAWRSRIDRRTETAWLQRAAGIVTVTPSWQRMLQQRWGAAKPVAFIPNGYDEADFAGLTPAARPAERVFRVVHTGTFYGARDPGGLLLGLATYLRAAPPDAPRLRVRLVGNIGARFAEPLRLFDTQHPGVIERVPYLPHRAALAELMAADALLLVVDPGAGPGGTAAALPGKIFEYLRAGKPVLMLGEPGSDAAELVRRHARGVVVDAERPERLAGALNTLIAGAADEAPAGPASTGTSAAAAARAARSFDRHGPLPAVAVGVAEAAGVAENAGVAGAVPLSPDVAAFERRELAGQLADFFRRCARGEA